jgi:mannosylglycerate hydrolase
VIDNTARNHTLQVMFPSGGQARVASSDTAFDVVSRGILRDDEHSYAQTFAPTHPCLRFVQLADDHDGLAVANVGLRGYQVTEDDDRAIVLTLIRAFEVNMCTVSYRWERRPDQQRSQALGRHEIDYSIIPHATDWRGSVVEEAERLNVPMLIVQAGRHDGTLPRAHSFLDVEPATIELSAVKKAEDRDTLVVRLFNPTDGGQDTTLTFFRDVAGARLLTLEEQPVDGDAVTVEGRKIRLHVGPKKIVTIELEPA